MQPRVVMELGFFSVLQLFTSDKSIVFEISHFIHCGKVQNAFKLIENINSIETIPCKCHVNSRMNQMKWKSLRSPKRICSNSECTPPQSAHIDLSAKMQKLNTTQWTEFG